MNVAVPDLSKKSHLRKTVHDLALCKVMICYFDFCQLVTKKFSIMIFAILRRPRYLLICKISIFGYSENSIK